MALPAARGVLLRRKAVPARDSATVHFRPNVSCPATRQLLHSQRQRLGRPNIPSRTASTRMEARRHWGRRSPIQAKALRGLSPTWGCPFAACACACQSRQCGFSEDDLGGVPGHRLWRMGGHRKGG